MVTLVASTASIAASHEDQAAQTVLFPSVKGDVITLIGHLRRPDGAGPFPAVVLLHGCGGDWRGMDSRWGTRLVEWGYVALSVDSYTPRGIKSTCGSFWRSDPGDHMFDAYGALSYLTAQPYVVPDRTVVMGASGGGTIALMDAERQPEWGFRQRFRAAVAFYPDCRRTDGPLAIPTLILIGQLDGITPARYCEGLAQGYSLRPADSDIRLTVFPDAYHAFDNTAFPKQTPFLDSWLKYDADATTQAVKELRNFLRENVAWH